MEAEFVPYEQALELKELGFDEPCFAYCIQEPYYNSKKELKYKKPTYYEVSGWRNSDKLVSAEEDNCIYITLPLYQQAFKFFREKYNLCGEVYTVNMGAIDYTFLIRDLYSEDVKYDNFEANTGGYSGTFTTYEEAELKCLKKLIQIVNNFSKKVSE